MTAAPKELLQIGLASTLLFLLRNCLPAYLRARKYADPFAAFVGGADIRNTLFWGPDKTCWPPDFSRAACWAVPESPLRRKAFGPDTDKWMVLDRYVKRGFTY